MARPLKDIDPIEVEKLAGIGATVEEIADFFMCDRNTIYNRFSAQLDKGRADLKLSLRQMQLKAARNGNVVMMIWLGKQMLGQIDRAQLDVHKIPDDIFLEEAQRRLKSGPEEPRDVSADTNELPKDKAKV